MSTKIKHRSGVIEKMGGHPRLLHELLAIERAEDYYFHTSNQREPRQSHERPKSIQLTLLTVA